MKKKFSILIAMIMVIALCLVPAVAQADSVGLSGTIYAGYLDLENKDSAWQPISDTIGGTLGYNKSGPTFDWGLDAQVLMPSTEYALIYYADQPDRYVNWGGDNPGALIGIVTSDVNGAISTSGSVDLGMDLPCPPDANQFEISYGDSPDFYVHHHGAKIWLVPASYLPTSWPNDGGWMTWSALIVSNILFETDLITYDDTGVESTIVAISVDPTAIDFGVMQAGEVADGGSITVANDGTVPASVTASVSGSAFSGLMLDGGAVSAYDPEIPVDKDVGVAVTLLVPNYGAGEYTGTLIFLATGPVPTP